MLRSMYSGISGMKNFQTKLDVIGNNIANVNTYGFKKGRTIFTDIMSQTINGATAPGQNLGGVNPKQVGLGSSLAAIDTVHNPGSIQTTARVLDVAISGDGFFQVSPTSTKATGFDQEAMYTRAGNLYLDQEGYLVTSSGMYVHGFGSYQATVPQSPEPSEIDPKDFTFAPGATPGYSQTATPTVPIAYKPIRIPTDAKSMSIGKDGSVTYVDAAGTLRWAGQMVLSKFPNSGGLEKVGGNLFKESSNSGAPVLNFAGQSGLGSVESGALEMSNVDLSEEFTEMIVAQRGFQANTRIITTSDEILQELVNLKR
ncbi:flagellar basal-body rod protein FlgG [Fredinandcohnia quinoae]|uniref:Flagellar hook protein FlgE n=1 Tax=Fredinandcohnia quinoae TaxID=2918902 RepID=A0AAW5E3S6_9BACI|nr:flagellar basal-body rod protein FlgG [Fredinandcohnia sp. SECRCQ15]MCH1623778.1 flagellar basal-body rod protein FlgG [Fredinandcohnia sp. SECRCQ15]